MKYKLMSLTLFTLIIILTSCTSNTKIQCTQDSDCAAATCCHATEAVNRDNAPNCREAICTANCEPDTLDCGQGRVRCLNSQCTVVFENS